MSEETLLTETELKAQVKLQRKDRDIRRCQEVLAPESIDHNRKDQMAIITSEWTV